MGFWDRLLSRPEKIEKRGYLEHALGASLWTSPAGITVTPEGAENSAAVQACVRVLQEAVAALPLILYRRLPDGGKERASDHPLFRMLHTQPNPEFSSFEWREMMVRNLCLWGNALYEIQLDRRGYPSALWPLAPQRVSIERRDGAVRYHYDMDQGGRVTLPADRVLHVRMSSDGLWGESPVRQGLRSIGLDLAAEEYGSRYFANGASPGVILKHPGVLGEQALRNLRETWTMEHGGLANAHRLRILEEGMEIDKLTSPPDEAQYLQTRRFQRSVIAGWFKVPPHKIGELERGASFASIEQQQRSFYDDTLLPWLRRIEEALSRSLLTPQETEDLRIEHLADGILRADTQTRYQAYALAIQNGFMNRNEVRSLENMNPYDGGDEYLVPLNMSLTDQDPGEEPEEEEENRALPLDFRADDAGDDARLISRQKLARSFQPLLEDSAGRMVRREVADLRRAVQKYLIREQNPEAFKEWMSEFYNGLREIMPSFWRSQLETLAAQVITAAAAELDKEDPGVTDETREFIDGYIDAYSGQYVAEHHKRLKGVMAGEEPLEEKAATVTEWADRWEEQEPVSQARDQAFEAMNALATATYAALGTRYLMWLATGESCPYCRGLSGKIVGIDGWFVTDGDQLPGEGAKHMQISRSRRHAPLHKGCDCIVVPA